MSIHELFLHSILNKLYKFIGFFFKNRQSSTVYQLQKLVCYMFKQRCLAEALTKALGFPSRLTINACFVDAH